MRTTIELPDSLYRQVKAKAALEGVPMKTLVQRLVEDGLAAPAAPHPAMPRSAPPTLSIGQRLPERLMSNAALFELAEGEE
jgi:hypothetical protein